MLMADREMSAEDTIDVRDDEGFDTRRLAGWLRARSLPGSDAPLRVRQFGGGKANLTYLLDFGTHEYVLRRPPLGPVPKGAHDMTREFGVLSRLHEHFEPAPRALLFCGDPAVIGADFFVMDRRHGRVVRQTMPDAYTGIPDAAARMSDALVDTLADLHRVDPVAAGLADIGRIDGFLERQVEGWTRRWQAAKVFEIDSMNAVHAWLVARRPVTQSTALVHNDYKLDNAMFAIDDPGHLVAVFDWDMCTLGDPLADLGAMLTYWCEPDDPPEFRAIATMPAGAGFATRAQLVQRYARRSGLDVSAIRYYHVLGLYRLAVILAQIYVRYHRGQTRDERFVPFGEFTKLAAGWALRIADAAG